MVIINALDIFLWPRDICILCEGGMSVPLAACCPRANGAKRRSGRKPGARVTNSARLFTPGEKDSIADSKVVVIVGWGVVISLISKKWMFIRSGRGKNYKK